MSVAPAARRAAARTRTIAVTGWAVHVPGADPLATPPERAHELLGRRGLLAKEPATRLALCAVHRALGLPAGAPKPAGPPDPRVAVVASSNLGNVATVRRVAEAVRGGGIREVSPLDVPNASSNVVASSVAIWFRLGGPNLMVCSGSTSGLDAIALASLLLRAGRADRCVVVGAEPDDEVAGALRRGGRAGAGAVVLEPAAPGVAPAVVLGPVRPAPDGGQGSDPAAELGDLYGAHGVVQVALGAALVAAGAPAVTCVCGDEADGWRSVELEPGR